MLPLSERDANQSLRSTVGSSLRPETAGKSHETSESLGRGVTSMLKNDLGDLLDISPQDRMPAFLNRTSQIPRGKHNFGSSSAKAVHRPWPSTTSSGRHRSFTSSVTAPARSLPDTSFSPMLGAGSVPPLPLDRRSGDFRSYSLTTTIDPHGLASQRSFASLNSDAYSVVGHRNARYHARKKRGYRSPSPSLEEIMMMRNPHGIRHVASSIGLRGRESPLSDYGPSDRFAPGYHHVRRRSQGIRGGHQFRPIYEPYGGHGFASRPRTPIVRNRPSSPEMYMQPWPPGYDPPEGLARHNRMSMSSSAPIPTDEENLPQVYDYSTYISYAEELPADDLRHQVPDAVAVPMDDRVKSLTNGPGTPSLETLRQNEYEGGNAASQSNNFFQEPSTPIPPMPGAYGSSYPNLAELATTDIAAAELPASPVQNRQSRDDDSFTLASIPGMMRGPSDPDLPRPQGTSSSPQTRQPISFRLSSNSSVLSGGGVGSASTDAIERVNSSMTDLSTNFVQSAPPKVQATNSVGANHDIQSVHSNSQVETEVKEHHRSTSEVVPKSTPLKSSLETKTHSRTSSQPKADDRDTLPSQIRMETPIRTRSTNLSSTLDDTEMSCGKTSVSVNDFGQKKENDMTTALMPEVSLPSLSAPRSQSRSSSRPNSPPPTPWERINKSRASSTSKSTAPDRTVSTAILEDTTTSLEATPTFELTAPPLPQRHPDHAKKASDTRGLQAIQEVTDNSQTHPTPPHKSRPESTRSDLDEQVLSNTQRSSKKEPRRYGDIAVDVAKRLVRDTPLAKHIAGKPSKHSSLQSISETDFKINKFPNGSSEENVSHYQKENLVSVKEESGKSKTSRFIATKFRFPSSLLSSKDMHLSTPPSPQPSVDLKTRSSQQQLLKSSCEQQDHGQQTSEFNNDAQSPSPQHSLPARSYQERLNSTLSLATSPSRDLPSLHFSRLDLTSDIRDSLWTGSIDFSMESLSFEDVPPSPEPEPRYKYQSVFDRLDAYSPEAYQDQAPSATDGPGGVAASIKTGQNSKKSSSIRSPMASMPSKAYIDEINRLSIPSADDIALRFSDLIPSLGLFSSPGVEVPEISTKSGLDRTLTQINKIGNVEPYQKAASMLRNVPSDVMFRPVPGSENLVLMTDTEFETLMRIQRTRAERESKSQAKGSVSSIQPSCAASKSEAEDEHVDASSTSSITRPAPILTRARSESAMYVDDGPRRISPPKSHTFGVSLPNIQKPSPAASRPWNFDGSYTWEMKLPNLDIAVPKTPRVTPTPVRGGEDNISLLGSGLPANSSRSRPQSANPFSDKHCISPTPTPLSGNPVDNRVQQTASRNSRVCSGDRYPTTGLSPPDEIHLVDDGDHRSWFSDDSSITRRPGGFRRRFTRMRSRTGNHRERSQSRREVNGRPQTRDESPAQDDGSIIRDTPSVRTYAGAVGMSRFEFGTRRIAQKVRSWWFKGGHLLKAFGSRRLPSPAFGARGSEDGLAERFSII